MNKQLSADLARLKEELNGARERLAATQEILGVVSQSRKDEQPVFEAILNSATQLCDVPVAALMLLNEVQGTFHMAAHLGDWKVPVATETTWSVDAPLPVAQSFREARTIHVTDMKESAPYLDGDPTYRRMVDAEGLRTRLCVPLLIGGKAIGTIVLSRLKLQPFDDDEIALIEGFAAQAVIAIENVRQFLEVRNRLEREKASADILNVISHNRDDDLPVFDVILRNAARLCDAQLADLDLVDEDRQTLREVATWGLSERVIPSERWVWPLDSDFLHVAAVRNGKVAHVADVQQTDRYRDGDPMTRAVVDEEGIRAFLAVPLISSKTSLGCLVLFRKEPIPFTEDQIALVETFADQAVIAIENVHQFREVQERLAREAASADILHVISQSRDDDVPVFETILENASRLCEAPLAFMSVVTEDGTAFRVPAHLGAGPEIGEIWSHQLEALDGSDLTTSHAIRTLKAIHVEDLSNDPNFGMDDPRRAELVTLEGVRSYLVVPLIKDDLCFGTINLYRREVRPFAPDQIALLENFAAQAVIAIENVRQFRALELLNAELETRVEDQVDEIERMSLLKRFLPTAVADTVVSSGSEDMLKSHRALLGVLFCDIRGFTAFCETAEPEETIEVLQTYHEEMGRLINAHGAGVDHRSGDGIMVLFNDPIPCDDPAGDAVRLAIAMRTRMSELCQKWKRMGYRLGFGVGLSLGYATVGMVGFEGRFDYTASGTAINLASRLCDEAEDGEILLSPRAAIAVEDEFQVMSRGELTLKGLREPLEVFQLVVGAAT